MTRSVDQYEINEEKEFRRFADPEKLYQEDEDVIRSGSTVKLGADHPTVVFRYVARNDDTRTMISTALPETGFQYCAGYIHAVVHEPEATAEDLLALCAYFNSFTCDWWLRRIVDRHVNSPMVNHVPLPEWSDDQVSRVADLSAELIRRGGTETLPGGRDIPSNTGHGATDRDEIRAQIESIVAKGFELERDELGTILHDFSKKACSRDLRERILSLAEDSTSDAPTAEQDDD